MDEDILLKVPPSVNINNHQYRPLHPLRHLELRQGQRAQPSDLRRQPRHRGAVQGVRALQELQAVLREAEADHDTAHCRAARRIQKVFRRRERQTRTGHENRHGVLNNESFVPLVLVQPTNKYRKIPYPGSG